MMCKEFCMLINGKYTNPDRYKAKISCYKKLTIFVSVI